MDKLRDFRDMTWVEVEAALALQLPAILPLGAVEQHGHHLPLTVDDDLATGVSQEIASRTGFFLLPSLTYGDAWTNSSFPGTISLKPDTLRAMIIDIGQECLRMGMPALITLNGHFGNSVPIAQAAVVLANEGLPVLSLAYPGLENLAADICDSTPAGPGFFHADEVETSMMLALRPEAVRMDAAAPQYPTFPKTFGAEPMQLRDFNPTGVFGDPRPSTAAKGRALIDGIADHIDPLIAAFLTRHNITPLTE